MNLHQRLQQQIAKSGTVARNFLFSSELPNSGLQAPAAELPSGKNVAPNLSAITAWYNRQLIRQQQDIQKLVKAVEEAENGYLPRRVELIRTYNDLVLDAHLTAVMNQRRSAVLSRKFTVTVGGKDVTSQFDELWFYTFLEHAWDAMAFGYSVVGLGDIVGGEVSEVKLLERHLINPDNNLYTPNPYSMNGIRFDSDELVDWYIPIYTGNLGWLHKAGFHVLSKKFVFTSWDEYAMIFGVPIRVAKLDGGGEADKDKIADDLYNMGPAGVLTLNKEDEFELHGGGQGAGSSFQIFKEHIASRNEELSKLVVGQTMTTDNGSSQSQATVHERVAKNIQAQDLRWIKHVVNKLLMPRLQRLGVVKGMAEFTWDQDELLSLTEQKDVDDMILRNGLKIPASYFFEKYGVPVEEVAEPAPSTNPPTDPPGKLVPQRQGRAVGQKTEASKNITPNHNALNVDAPNHITVFRDARVLYHVHPDSCGCEAQNKKVAGPDPGQVFDDAYLEGVLQEFFSGKYQSSKLPEDLYQKTAAFLFDGVTEGFGGQAMDFDWGTPNREMIEALKRNIYIFSGAKTYQQRKAYNDLIRTPEGRIKGWDEYKKDAMQLAKDYNVNYLRSEYEAATGNARMAAKWVDIEANAAVLPLLRYSTVGDANVREAHRKLDGIVRKWNDPFWDRYMPKNGWGCRCDVEQLEKDQAEVTSLKHFGELGPKDQPRAFRFNPGKKKMVFSPEHPYFKIEPMDKQWASENFELPIPEPEVPLANGLKANGTPVSNALKLGKMEFQNQVEEAMTIMDSIHGDGNLPTIDVVQDNRMNAQGEFVYWIASNTGSKIKLSRNAMSVAGTFWHEVGHFLDLNGFGRNGYSSEVSGSAISEIVDVASMTDEIQNIMKLPGIKPSSRKYYLERTEIFARAYSQYISVKSGHVTALQKINDIVSYNSWVKNIQWTDESFDPIFKKMEEVFERIGWMRKK